MSRLSDLVHEGVDATRDDDGAVRIAAAVASIKSRLEDEDRDQLVGEALTSRCKSAAQAGKRAARAAQKNANSTLDLFPGLRPAYAIDAEERVVKDTRSLTMLEFRRLISIREKQIKDDGEHLKVLRNTYESSAPLWDTHQDWTFGLVCDALGSMAEAV